MAKTAAAKTTAERQRAYRAGRALAGDNGERRLNTWVTTDASRALDRLARRYGVTKLEMIERLVIAADNAESVALDPDGEEWAAYFGTR